MIETEWADTTDITTVRSEAHLVISIAPSLRCFRSSGPALELEGSSLRTPMVIVRWLSPLCLHFRMPLFGLTLSPVPVC